LAGLSVIDENGCRLVYSGKLQAYNIISMLMSLLNIPKLLEPPVEPFAEIHSTPPICHDRLKAVLYIL